MRPESGLAYRQERALDVELAGQPLRLVSRPGFAEWGHISQAMQLLAARAAVAPGERALVCPCGHGALGVWAQTHTASRNVLLLDTNLVATEMARRTLAANDCPDVRVEVGLPSEIGGVFDVVMMTLPKGRDLARLWFLECHAALREGGRFYLAGPNDGGIKSAIGDAETLYGPSTLLAYKGGNRVVSFVRGSLSADGLPPMYRAPGLAPGSCATLEVELQGELYRACTRPGVFSWRSLDSGTRVLLETLQVRVTDQVLDIGCGYGIIGLYAAKHASRGRVTLVDVDALACACARMTLAANNASGEVLLGDGLAAVAGQRYTLIVSNPPFHHGHEPAYEVAEALVRESHRALEPRGRLVLVANRFLPYDRLMAEVFGSVVPLNRTPQFHVLSAEKAYQRRPRGKPRRSARDEETIYQIPDR